MLSRAGMGNQMTVHSTPAASQIRFLPSDLEPSDETSVQEVCDVQGQTGLEEDECVVTLLQAEKSKCSCVESKASVCIQYT